MMRKKFSGKNLLAGLSSALLLAAALAVRADVIALYAFNGNSLASTDTDQLSVATVISLGSGLADTARFTTGASPAPSLRVNTDETDGTSFSTAIAAGDFFLFTLAPTSGYRFVFSTFSVNLATSSTTFSTNVLVQASVDGGNSLVTVDSEEDSNTTFRMSISGLDASTATPRLQPARRCCGASLCMTTPTTLTITRPSTTSPSTARCKPSQSRARLRWSASARPWRAV